MITSVTKATEILKLFLKDQAELSLKEISDAFEMHKSSVYRTLSTLVAARFLEKDEITNKYRLGLIFLDFAGNVLHRFNFRDQARPYLEKLAEKSGADVEFLGRVSEDKLVEMYSRCKAFIFSAIDEDFGMTPLEAMASGKPVLCVNEGGPLEYLNDKISFLFDDVTGLRELIKAHDTDDYASMKDDCIRLAGGFDRRAVAKRMKREIELILEEFY